MMVTQEIVDLEAKTRVYLLSTYRAFVGTKQKVSIILLISPHRPNVQEKATASVEIGTRTDGGIYLEFLIAGWRATAVVA